MVTQAHPQLARRSVIAWIRDLFLVRTWIEFMCLFNKCKCSAVLRGDYAWRIAGESFCWTFTKVFVRLPCSNGRSRERDCPLVVKLRTARHGWARRSGWKIAAPFLTPRQKHGWVRAASLNPKWLLTTPNGKTDMWVTERKRVENTGELMPFCCWFWLCGNQCRAPHASILLNPHFNFLPHYWILLGSLNCYSLNLWTGRTTEGKIGMAEFDFQRHSGHDCSPGPFPLTESPHLAAASWQRRCELTFIWQGADSARGSLPLQRLVGKKWSTDKVVYYTLSTLQRLKASLGPVGFCGRHALTRKWWVSP